MALTPAQATILVLVGFVVLVAGIAIVYWPAAMIVGGAGAVAFGSLFTTVKSDAGPEGTIEP